MTDDEHEQAVELTNTISKELKRVVDTMLRNPRLSPEVEETVRIMLSEQIRFYK